ncbi:SPFH domain-containing protein [Cellulomonas sp.]|uniref:SPFH domain-containing protein n=1 Tax=Cellulomonas sp. TaxID=40001 RepID=UPI003BAD3DD5
MGLISAATAAVGGTLADQWVDFFTAPAFDEQTVVAPGVIQANNNERGSNTRGSTNIVTDGSRIAVPENTAVIITDGGGIVSASTEPGYFVFRNDGQPSIFAGSGPRRSLLTQSWERLTFGGQPGQQQLVSYVNLRELRNLPFGTPGPLPYKDLSLVPPGSSQAPVLRLRARGRYSVRVVDPIRFFRTVLPPNVRSYTLADDAARAQLTQEFITTFQGALQALSRTTDIASLAAHGPELAAEMTSTGGPAGSWIERFGLEVVGVAVSTIEYDQASRDLMDKYNKGVLLGGGIGNAYAQATVADSALAMAEGGPGGAGMAGLALGLGAIGGTVSGLTQPSAPAPAAVDPVAVLSQLKAMLDQGLISQEQYAAKQGEVLGRM